MRLALIVALLSASPALAASRDPATLTTYQTEVLATAGIAQPPADAVAAAAILVDRQFAEDEAERPMVDRIVEGWTSGLESEKYGPPCDVANDKCAASARSAARAVETLFRSKFRDLAVVIHAMALSQRYTVAELATVRAFVATPAGAKTLKSSFFDGPLPQEKRLKAIGDDLSAQIDIQRRRFLDETRSLPRYKRTIPTMPPLDSKP